MKHAYTNMSQCLHAWANPEAIEGSAEGTVGEGPDWHGHAGNVSWEGRTVYSYGHYPIAVQLDIDKFDRQYQRRGGRSNGLSRDPLALFQIDTYSVSTSRHISEAKRCTRADYGRQWDVDHVGNSPEDHRRNYAAMLERIGARMEKAERSRCYILEEVEGVKKDCERANNYAWFLIEASVRPERHVIEPAWLERMKEKAETRRRTTYAREEKQRAKDEAHAQATAEKTALAELAFTKRMKWLRLLPWLPVPDGYAIYRKGENRSIVSRFSAPAVTRRTFAEWEKEWRAGGGALPHSMRAAHDTRRAALVRWSASRTDVQTSGGASVPVREAERLWDRVMLCKNRGIEYRHGSSSNNGREPVVIGGYRLDSISSEGDVRMGCHGFKFAEMRALAIQLELVRPTFLERLAA